MATEISQFSFTFTWTPVTSDCGSTASYEIDADSADCGTCTVNGGTPSATCTGWTPRGQNCSVRVRVRTEICGGLVGDFSDPLILFLKGTSYNYFVSPATFVKIIVHTHVNVLNG